MSKSDSLELVDYSSVSGAVCDLGEAGSEEEFEDDYFPRPGTGKISYLRREDLDEEKPKGSGSIPTTADTATLLAGICMFSPHCHSIKIFIIFDQFIHNSGR